MSIGHSLKTVRERSGLTQEEVAEQLFVTRQTNSRWEQDKTLPNIYALQELSALYDTPLEALIHGHEVQSEKEITKMEQNKTAIFIGTMIWNGLLIFAVGGTVALLLLAGWMIIGSFFALPVILLIANLVNYQAYELMNTILSIVCFIVALISFTPLKNLTIKTWNYTKQYIKFNKKVIIDYQEGTH